MDLKIRVGPWIFVDLSELGNLYCKSPSNLLRFLLDRLLLHLPQKWSQSFDIFPSKSNFFYHIEEHTMANLCFFLQHQRDNRQPHNAHPRKDKSLITWTLKLKIQFPLLTLKSKATQSLLKFVGSLHPSEKVKRKYDQIKISILQRFINHTHPATFVEQNGFLSHQNCTRWTSRHDVN